MSDQETSIHNEQPTGTLNFDNGSTLFQFARQHTSRSMIPQVMTDNGIELFTHQTTTIQPGGIATSVLRNTPFLLRVGNTDFSVNLPTRNSDTDYFFVERITDDMMQRIRYPMRLVLTNLASTVVHIGREEFVQDPQSPYFRRQNELVISDDAAVSRAAATLGIVVGPSSELWIVIKNDSTTNEIRTTEQVWSTTPTSRLEGVNLEQEQKVWQVHAGICVDKNGCSHNDSTPGRYYGDDVIVQTSAVLQDGAHKTRDVVGDGSGGTYAHESTLKKMQVMASTAAESLSNTTPEEALFRANNAGFALVHQDRKVTYGVMGVLDVTKRVNGKVHIQAATVGDVQLLKVDSRKTMPKRRNDTHGKEHFIQLCTTPQNVAEQLRRSGRRAPDGIITTTFDDSPEANYIYNSMGDKAQIHPPSTFEELLQPNEPAVYLLCSDGARPQSLLLATDGATENAKAAQQELKVLSEMVHNYDPGQAPAMITKQVVQIQDKAKRVAQSIRELAVADGEQDDCTIAIRIVLPQAALQK